MAAPVFIYPGGFFVVKFDKPLSRWSKYTILLFPRFKGVVLVATLRLDGDSINNYTPS